MSGVVEGEKQGPRDDGSAAGPDFVAGLQNHHRAPEAKLGLPPLNDILAQTEACRGISPTELRWLDAQTATIDTPDDRQAILRRGLEAFQSLQALQDRGFVTESAAARLREAAQTSGVVEFARMVEALRGLAASPHTLVVLCPPASNTHPLGWLGALASQMRPLMPLDRLARELALSGAAGFLEKASGAVTEPHRLPPSLDGRRQS